MIVAAITIVTTIDATGIVAKLDTMIEPAAPGTRL